MSVTNMFDMFCILLNEVKYINVGIKVVKQKGFLNVGKCYVTLFYVKQKAEIILLATYISSGSQTCINERGNRNS